MTPQSVVLELPDEIYERARQVAEESQRPLESVLLDSLTLLFGDFPAELTPEALRLKQYVHDLAHYLKLDS